MQDQRPSSIFISFKLFSLQGRYEGGWEGAGCVVGVSVVKGGSTLRRRSGGGGGG